MNRMKDWMRMRDRHLSEVLCRVNGGITAREYTKGKIGGWKSKDHFHSG